MTNTLRVRNLAQKVLWDEELSGQISDGLWENSAPRDHWQAWTNATVVVDPDHVGKNFFARRNAYNFSDKRLLDVVGERMLEAVRVATGDASYDMKRLRADLNDLKTIIKENVPAGTPLPAQPVARKARLVLDGYPQEFVVYVEVADDPRAVEALAKRAQDASEYRLKRVEEKLADAQSVVAKLEAEKAALAADLGLLV